MPTETPTKPATPTKPKVEPPPVRKEPPAHWKCRSCMKTAGSAHELCDPMRIA
jgi:hypothetical protein